MCWCISSLFWNPPYPARRQREEEAKAAAEAAAKAAAQAAEQAGPVQDQRAPAAPAGDPSSKLGLGARLWAMLPGGAATGKAPSAFRSAQVSHNTFTRQNGRFRHRRSLGRICLTHMARCVLRSCPASPLAMAKSRSVTLRQPVT